MSRAQLQKHRNLIALSFGVSLLALTTWTRADAANRVDQASSLNHAPLHPVSSESASSAADTLRFGYVDVDGYAIEGETWTWDNGGSVFEGWEPQDLTEQTDAIAFFRRVTTPIWDSGGNFAGTSVDAPILNGVGSLWCGFFRDEADNEAWLGGLGYGNNWRQEVASPVLNYGGSGDVGLSFIYFVDLEPGFDFMHLDLRTLPSGAMTPLMSFSGQEGLAVNHPIDPPDGDGFAINIGQSLFGGENQFQVVLTIIADGGASDQDDLFPTSYGPFGIDDVEIQSVDIDTTFTFEDDLENWTTAGLPGIGTFLGVANVSEYSIEKSCLDALSGNVLEMHNDGGEHPVGQHTLALSNPVDVLNDVSILGSGDLEIYFEWDQYSDLPLANGVFYRPGFSFYPFTNPNTGDIIWSGVVGPKNFVATGDLPVCDRLQSVATDHGVPSDVEEIRFVYELYASCDAFAILPEQCSGLSNFTPLLDNAELVFTRLEDPADVPDATELESTDDLQVSPNPFQNRTTLRFSIANRGPVELTIYDVQGRKTRSLLLRTLDAGTHEIVWDGRNDRGELARNGVFWSQLRAGGKTTQEKVTLQTK